MARQQQRQNPKIKRHLLLLLFANTLAVLLQLMVFYDKTTTKAKRHVNHHTWSPALGNLATVIAIASQYFLDSIYYPTEEDEEGGIGNPDRSQRQPLLSIQERDAVDPDTAGAGAASTSSTAAAASLPAATGASTRQTYEV
mmetsp:Transcript_2743/g.3916  ORF Transcript_2743/g.3916 Transcript_2743/m.3916 type:complete len:141 (-) Transcript_2743:1818-2240(-)